MRVISAKDIASAVSYPDIVEALRDGFRSDVTAPLRHHHEISRGPKPDALFLLMPAWSNMSDGLSDGQYVGLKAVTLYPDNQDRNEPTIQGIYLLLDGATGRPLALLDGTELTLRRTACASALAADYLARSDATNMVMIGAGALARHVVRAHAAVRPIKSVSIWNRTIAKARSLADELKAEGFAAEAVDTPEAACRQADLISCATMSDHPLVLGEWLKPGAHVDMMGAFRRDLRESDDEVMRRGSVFVDTREGAFAEAGDIIQAIDSGALSESAVKGDLFDLTRDQAPGRRSNDEITVFKSVGTALEDLAAAISIHLKTR